MAIREALHTDIEPMHIVRMAVKENRLNTPDLVQHKDYEAMLTDNGKGWVYETAGKIVGFAIVDVKYANIWALFVLPQEEGKGIGKQLHDEMIRWCFGNGISHLWLSTAPGTRAEKFYEKAGWIKKGVEPNGEVRFEIVAPNSINGDF